MTIIRKIGLLVMMQLLTVNIYAQDNSVHRRLRKLAEDFIAVHNSGDTAQYHRFLRSQSVPVEKRNDLLRRYMNSYMAIGKVSPVHYSFPAGNSVKITAQEARYESWWEFTVNATADQVFLNRTVLPIPYPSLALKAGKVERNEIGDQIDSYVTKNLGENFSGNVWVLKGSKSIFKKSYGRDHMGQVNTSQTSFNLASMGKMFTAVSLLKLKEQGRLKFTDTVGKFLPELKNSWVKALNISQLLTHTSGMGDYFETKLFGRFRDSLSVPNDYLRFIEEDRPSFPAGTNFRYSNTGFSLLGIIIEKVAGTSYREFLQRNIFRPSNMSATVAGNGDGGGLSTSEDLVRFAHALLGGRLIGPEATNAFLNDAPYNNYGYGSEHHQLVSEHIVGHSGSLENLNNEFNIYLKSGYLVVILSNTPPPIAHHLSNKIKGLLVSK